ncbi:hypothetical protein T492DRAFT_1085198 [Pavlovales sp. CCMP2436]|nr:hypothetical protein T492DRAFT_1085198 [Pavlovales sp. CCMP2436]
MAIGPAIFLTWLVCLSASASEGTHGLSVFPRAFSREECERITQHFAAKRVERDVRIAASVSRTNYWDHTPGSGEYDWIYERILTLLAAREPLSKALWGRFDPLALRTPAELAGGVEFVLLHEFKTGDFFDWHVDTNPGDKTGRTLNINIMLSPPDAYDGGELSVGTELLRAGQGDLSIYPASLPHRVADVSGGLRHTFVIALSVPDSQRASSGYWDLARANHGALKNGLPTEPKLHLLRGEWLSAQGDESGADEAFADGYACTAEALAYATQFYDEGLRLLSEGDRRAALQHFEMAVRVDPTNAAYAERRDGLKYT